MAQDNSRRPTTLRDCRILVLENEPLILMMYESELGHIGCTGVFTATDTASALKLLSTVRVDIAILDVRLGSGAKSFEVASRLQSGGTPFIFATGAANSELPPEFRDVGVVTKPFGPQDLERALLAALTP